MRGMARLAEIIGPSPSELDWQQGLERLRIERQRVGKALDWILAHPTTRTKAARASRKAVERSEKVRKLTPEERALEAKLQSMGLSLEQFAAMLKGQEETVG